MCVVWTLIVSKKERKHDHTSCITCIFFQCFFSPAGYWPYCILLNWNCKKLDPFLLMMYDNKLSDCREPIVCSVQQYIYYEKWLWTNDNVHVCLFVYLPPLVFHTAFDEFKWNDHVEGSNAKGFNLLYIYNHLAFTPQAGKCVVFTILYYRQEFDYKCQNNSWKPNFKKLQCVYFVMYMFVYLSTLVFHAAHDDSYESLGHFQRGSTNECCNPVVRLLTPGIL